MEHDGCENCFYADKLSNEEPCVRCKGTVSFSHEEYHTRPDLWSSDGSLSTMKYNIGDKVLIKSNLRSNDNVVDFMFDYEGKIMTIVDIVHEAYIMEEDNGDWYWSEDMIECGFSDNVNHPAHYTRENAMECFDEFIAIYGIKAGIHACLFNIHKYRYRASNKNGEEDLKKSDWYMKKYVELKDKKDGKTGGEI